MSRRWPAAGGLTAWLCVMLWCGGCAPDVAWLDRRDRETPLIKRAMAKRAAGDIEGAVALYREALNADSRMARAHLDLALLLHQEKNDYFNAVCHYRRYLDMRPATQKRQMIEIRMKRAMQLWLASMEGGSAPAPGGGTEQGAELARALKKLREAEEREKRLRTQVQGLDRAAAALRVKVRQLEQEAERTRALAASSRGDRPVAPPPVTGTGSGVPRTYRVRRGDSLSSIASDVYGDSTLWRRIFNANRDKLGDSPEIKIGQVLVIP